MTNLNKVFVYGTLKKGYGNNRLLQGSSFLGKDKTKEEYILGDVGFPYAFPSYVFSEITPPQDLFKPVLGEVYEVDEETFSRLDHLEGVPYHYKREVIETEGGHSAWMYYNFDELSINHCYKCSEHEGAWKWLT